MNREKEYLNYQKLEGLKALIKKRFESFQNICWFANDEGIFILHISTISIPNVSKLLSEIEKIYKKVVSIQIRKFDNKVITILSFKLWHKLKFNPFHPAALEKNKKKLQEIERNRIKRNLEGKQRHYNRLLNMNIHKRNKLFPDVNLNLIAENIEDDKILIESFEKGIPKNEEKKKRYLERIKQIDEIAFQRLFQGSKSIHKLLGI